MKLNFWQIVGVILLLVGGGLWLFERTQRPAQSPTTSPAAAASQPAR